MAEDDENKENSTSYDPKDPLKADKPVVGSVGSVDEVKPVQVDVQKPTQTDPEPATPDKFQGCESYTVKQGDTLLKIANLYNVALEQVRFFNGINKQTLRIRAGQKIYIPKHWINVPTGE